MKIKIISIREQEVEFISKYGVATGIWKDRIKPEQKEYYVEIDVKDRISFDKIEINHQEELIIKSVTGGILISGLLKEYDTDGCATLKFEDTLVEVETNFDKGFMSICGSYISFVVSDIQVYDEHI